MSQININKYKKYENGSILEFRYEGISTSVFNEEKVERLIEIFLNEEKSVGFMSRNISYIRTILKDTKEKLLVIKYSDKKNMETVKYHNQNLVLFECKKYNNESSNYMEAKFRPGQGLKVSFSDLETDSITRHQQVENIKYKFGKIIEHIEDLKNAGFVYFGNDEKALIEIYKLFYKENPDFSKEDINIKMQAMVSILTQFDIHCGDYRFYFNEEMPESISLFQIVYNMFPLGEITVIEDPVQLKESVKESITLIGETVRDMIGNQKNLNDALIAISKAIYAGRYDILCYDIKELIENSNINLTYKEAESSYKLVEKVKSKLHEDMLNKKAKKY